jgi:hypothetical protein
VHPRLWCAVVCCVVLRAYRALSSARSARVVRGLGGGRRMQSHSVNALGEEGEEEGATKGLPPFSTNKLYYLVLITYRYLSSGYVWDPGGVCAGCHRVST